MDSVMMIGIAGGSGSGKTTLTDQLIERFAGQVTLLHQERYYQVHPELNPEERRKLNYDRPDALDFKLMAAQLRALKEGQSIDCPRFSRTLLEREPLADHLMPTPVVLVEGGLIFTDPAMLELMDIKIFVDADADVRMMRRIRQEVERGQDLNTVMEQYIHAIKPMHEQYVEPSKRHADLIVLEGGHNRVALEMIIDRIQSHIGKRWG